MHNIPSLKTGLFSKLLPLPLTAELLAAATTFESPPTEIAPPKNAEDCMRPRALIGRKVFIESLIAEFLINSLLRDRSDTLKLPEKGSVSEEQINTISLLQLLQGINYPLVC
ncbi:hypothetical protein WAI453_013564 [Rhynchosporium graminicola]